MRRLRALLAALLAACCIADAAAFDPPASGTPVTASGTVQFAFTPGDAADALLAGAIERARRQILVQAYSFTYRRIAQALVAAKRRGVDVRIIADREQSERAPPSLVPELAASGIPVFIDGEHDAAHNKVMVMDPDRADCAVVTGSYHFTFAAQHRNAENLLVLRGNPPLCAAFARDWHRHREHATPWPGNPAVESPR
jgi:phosphatidylserine/phosphatidylglycerophosphate/cardiolipin synthase-like enzyme